MFCIVEGKMYVSLMSLPHFLPVPPQKGIRKPKPGPKAVAGMLLFECEVFSIVFVDGSCILGY